MKVYRICVKKEGPNIVQETNADNRTVFYGYELLQRDKPVFVEEESKHTVVIVLHSTQYREMHAKDSG
jgi:hypothetical protein